MKQQSVRPDYFSRYDGKKSLPFTNAEYERRLTTLRHIMDEQNVSATVLTSMHNVAYYSGFLYCSFGRPYACVVTAEACTVVSANIDGSQPWRRSQGIPGAGGYREHDILVVGEHGAENITGFPYGPDKNIIDA